jgi:predicted phage-related endonuclease
MTADMWRGVDSEPYARDIYSGHYQQAVEVGFMVREYDGFELGYSPDGLVADDGLIEIKAPRAKTHINNTLAGGVPSHYYAQCQAALLVSGRKWLDYVSFCGGLPLYVHRVEPDQEWADAILAATKQAEEDITALVGAYRIRVAGQPMTERIPTYTTEPELKLA